MILISFVGVSGRVFTSCVVGIVNFLSQISMSVQTTHSVSKSVTMYQDPICALVRKASSWQTTWYNALVRDSTYIINSYIYIYIYIYIYPQNLFSPLSFSVF